jgi:hypothetical protein
MFRRAETQYQFSGMWHRVVWQIHRRNVLPQFSGTLKGSVPRSLKQPIEVPILWVDTHVDTGAWSQRDRKVTCVSTEVHLCQRRADRAKQGRECSAFVRDDTSRHQTPPRPHTDSRIEVVLLTAHTDSNRSYCNVTPYYLVDRNKRFGRICCQYSSFDLQEERLDIEASCFWFSELGSKSIIKKKLIWWPLTAMGL